VAFTSRNNIFILWFLQI